MSHILTTHHHEEPCENYDPLPVENAAPPDEVVQQEAPAHEPEVHEHIFVRIFVVHLKNPNNFCSFFKILTYLSKYFYKLVEYPRMCPLFVGILTIFYVDISYILGIFYFL